MRGTVKLVFYLSVLVSVVRSSQSRCDRTPDGNPYPKSKSDGRFHIHISGSPESYVPGEQYTVFLRGTVNVLIQYKFKDFFLVVEQEAADPMREPFQKPSVGSFTLYGDTLTKFNEKCPNSVIQTNSLPKTEVQVLWKAPPSGSGCIAFHAMVVEQRDLWFMDDGDLTKVLCEEITESDDTQPPVLNRCCACDEAKYEVTFEGLWSRNTHPKDFPSNGWLTRFSDVIGASHTLNYTFWSYGDYASEGLRQVAENGNTRMLESELKAKSDHIRTIIKARGISYPNVTGKTFAVFRVDNRHHLMSLVSMIDPSPDWFVGVSSLELCLRNCSWIESKILNLYPWDAGTDDGFTYISPDHPTTPRATIRRIKSNSPNDPRSPFYDPTGAEMKPLARLYLSRQRLYEKNCDLSNVDTSDELEGNDDCRVTEWSEWSPCSATCGKGIKYRQRAYLNEASKFVCTKHLTGRGFCHGPQKRCPDHSEDILSDPMCQLTDWSEWSSCSVTCGRGTMTRDRRYLTRNATKHCIVGLTNPPSLQQSEFCFGRYQNCDEHTLDLSRKNETQDCPFRRWSEWSPCSVSCGQGYKVRTREPIDENDNSNTEEENDEDYDTCDDEKTKEVVGCVAEIPTCDIVSSSVDDICSMPKDTGPCRANIERWYFDIVRASCEVFSYTGCQGNRNNFETKNRCERVCGEFKKELIANRTTQKKQLGVSISGVLSYNLQMQDEANDDCEENYDEACKVTEWSEWSQCSETCGKGQKYRQRVYINEDAALFSMCTAELVQKRECRGYKKHCHRHKATTEVHGGLEPGSLILDRDQVEEDREITHETTGPVVDCQVSRWSKWSNCNATTACGKGYKQKYRHIRVHPMNGGKPCPKKLLKIRKCKVACEHNEDNEENKDNSLTATWGPPYLPNGNKVDCLMSQWSHWSPCSDTCGMHSVKQRTRRIIIPPYGGGKPCLHRVDTKPCNVLPCPIE